VTRLAPTPAALAVSVAALAAALALTASRAPVVLAVEDLHWIDEKSEEALAALVDLVAALPVLLLLTARPGYSHTLGERGHVNRLALGQLSAAGAVVGDSVNA